MSPAVQDVVESCLCAVLRDCAPRRDTVDRATAA
jgi:hypothetical protein